MTSRSIWHSASAVAWLAGSAFAHGAPDEAVRKRLGFIKECYGDKGGWHIVANESRIVRKARRTRLIHNIGRLRYDRDDFGRPLVVVLGARGSEHIQIGELAAIFAGRPRGCMPFSDTPFWFLEKRGKLVEVRQQQL